MLSSLAGVLKALWTTHELVDSTIKNLAECSYMYILQQLILLLHVSAYVCTSGPCLFGGELWMLTDDARVQTTYVRTWMLFHRLIWKCSKEFSEHVRCTTLYQYTIASQKNGHCLQITSSSTLPFSLFNLLQPGTCTCVLLTHLLSLLYYLHRTTGCMQCWPMPYCAVKGILFLWLSN